MRCTECGSENSTGRKFCTHCGAPFSNRCPKCGAENPALSKFCGDCGAIQIEKLTTSRSASASIQAQGERRHLTVLFCDLVGSTEIAHLLDPEEWREIVSDYQRAASNAIERFDGHVAKFLGDGVMAYFGYPQAHESDAEHAVHAGLAILDAISALNADRKSPQLAARIGIHTGSVVMGIGGGSDSDLFGDAPNLASRVQTVADPGSVLISAQTHRLVSGAFVVEDLGARQLKGIAEPIHLYRAVQASGTRGRFKAAAARGLTPFVGRDDEMRMLVNRWERVREGEGQVILVAGEAGIGKSRLVEQFHERLTGTPHTWIECASAPYFQNTPFYSVVDMLAQGFGWRGDQSTEAKLEQLERSLELSGSKLADAIPLIAPLLNLPVPEKYASPAVLPEQRRKRLLAMLAAWVFGTAQLQPTVIVLEDLHWVDPSTLEFLQILVEQGATAPLLLLHTARPEFHAPWPMRAHHAQITLNRLTNTDVREIVSGVAARTALAIDVVEALVNRTGGVPLFAEELTRAVLDSASRSTVTEIPATLHDSLMARLDQLGSAKEVAQIAAVIGRDFAYGLLQAVARMSENELQSALTKLADAELIYARGMPPDATYQFKHALIQDAAYEALLKTRRKELHRRVAEMLVQKFAATAEAQPEVLARHWTLAAESEPAIAAWRLAGDAALAHRSYKEAQEPFQQALTILSTLPESPERDARELELTSALANVLYVTKGYTALEYVAATTRARALAEKSGNLVQLVQQLHGTWQAAQVSGDYPAAAALANQLLDLADREGSSISLGLAHQAQLITRYWSGDLVGAEEHFKQGSTFFDTPSFNQVSGAAALTFCYSSLNAWTIGSADAARDRMRRAIAAAGENKSHFDMAMAQKVAGELYLFLRDPEQAETLAAQALALSDQYGFALGKRFSQICLGRARAQLGHSVEGVSLIREGLAGMAEVGASTGISRYLTYLAEAQALDGAIDDALGTIEQALAPNLQEPYFRPETLRVRGELRLKQELTQMAEDDFLRAIVLAQKMSAKTLELRATMSLTRLFEKNGKWGEARAMLANIYNWFTEGFDTLDLKDAKALLDKLS